MKFLHLSILMTLSLTGSFCSSASLQDKQKQHYARHPRAMVLNPPAAQTRVKSFQLQVSGDSIDAYRYRFNENNYSEIYSADAAIELNNLTDGFYRLEITGRHHNGNWQKTADATVIKWHVDNKAPQLDFQIDSNTGYVYQTAVNLLLKYNTGEINRLRLSNDGINFGNWQAAKPVISWQLLPENGIKTVYMQVQDAAGNGTELSRKTKLWQLLQFKKAAADSSRLKNKQAVFFDTEEKVLFRINRNDTLKENKKEILSTESRPSFWRGWSKQPAATENGNLYFDNNSGNLKIYKNKKWHVVDVASTVVVALRARFSPEKMRMYADWQGPAVTVYYYLVYVSDDCKTFNETYYTTEPHFSMTVDYDSLKCLLVTAVDDKGSENISELTGIMAADSKAGVLVVNGFDRPRGGSVDKNARNYTRYYLQAIKDAPGERWYADAVSNEAVKQGRVSLSDYRAVFWYTGRESYENNTFDDFKTSLDKFSEQTAIRNYLYGGGQLLISGTEIAWELDFESPGAVVNSTTANDETFLKNVLHAGFYRDTSMGSFAVAAEQAEHSLFHGMPPVRLDDGSGEIYRAAYSDRLQVHDGSMSALDYVSNSAGGWAATVYDREYRVVFLGFPFETILDPADRAAYAGRVLQFFYTGVSAMTADDVKQLTGLQPGEKRFWQYPNLESDAPGWVTSGGSSTTLSFGFYSKDSQIYPDNRNYHRGIDIYAPCSEKIYPVTNSVFVSAVTSSCSPDNKSPRGCEPGPNNRVTTRVNLDGDIFYFHYVHIYANPDLKPGDVLKATDWLGVSDGSVIYGCPNAHLHLQVSYSQDYFLKNNKGLVNPMCIEGFGKLDWGSKTNIYGQKSYPYNFNFVKYLMPDNKRCSDKTGFIHRKHSGYQDRFKKIID